MVVKYLIKLIFNSLTRDLLFQFNVNQELTKPRQWQSVYHVKKGIIVWVQLGIASSVQQALNQMINNLNAVPKWTFKLQKSKTTLENTFR